MARCTHGWEVVDLDINGTSYGPAVYRWCRACLDYVSLGPSTETEATLLERRAAKIAAKGRPRRCDYSKSDSFIDCAQCGWDDRELDVAVVGEERDGYWAGWLAHAIATHDDEHLSTENPVEPK